MQLGYDLFRFYEFIRHALLSSSISNLGIVHEYFQCTEIFLHIPLRSARWAILFLLFYPMNWWMKLATPKPALTIVGDTLTLVSKKTTCSDALEPKATRLKCRNRAYRWSKRFRGLPNIAIQLLSYRSRTTEHPRGFSRVLRSELSHLLNIHLFAGIWEGPWSGQTSHFGHLSGIGKHNEHPRVFAKFLTSEFAHLSVNGKPAQHPRSLTINAFAARTTFLLFLFLLLKFVDRHAIIVFLNLFFLTYQFYTSNCLVFLARDCLILSTSQSFTCASIFKFHAKYRLWTEGHSTELVKNNSDFRGKKTDPGTSPLVLV